MFASKHEINRTPPASSKRKLENEFDESSSDSKPDSSSEEPSKKLNLSCRSDLDPINQSSTKFGNNNFAN